jgi:hypothetical protein
LTGAATQCTRLVEDLPQGARRLRTSNVPDFDDTGHVQGAYTVTFDGHQLTEAQQRLQRSVERVGQEGSSCCLTSLHAQGFVRAFGEAVTSLRLIPTHFIEHAMMGRTMGMKRGSAP